jgi:NADH-quinone oxidoreductase subunit J
MVEKVVFFIGGIIAIISSIMVVLNRKVIYSAYSLLLLMISQSIMFFSLRSTYLGVVQLLVYAGGVIVLFVLVISLMGSGEEGFPSFRWWNIITPILLIVFLISLIYSIFETLKFEEGRIIQASADRLGYGVVLRNALAFEAVTLLLISALVGAIVFGRKKDD